MRILFLIIFLSLPVYAKDIEDNFPGTHPSRLSVLTQMFSKISQTSWQWRRDGVYLRRGECLHWTHEESGRTATCLKNLADGHYQLVVWGDEFDEIFEFKFSGKTDWTLEELLSFDAVSLAPHLKFFYSKKSGTQFDYNEGHLHFKTSIYSGYEFFSLTTKWSDDGLRQEVFGRCGTCSGKRYRAYLNSTGGIEYRAAHLQGSLSPRLWNEFLMYSYTYVLVDIAEALDLFDHSTH